jgi:hypothetical protein
VATPPPSPTYRLDLASSYGKIEATVLEDEEDHRQQRLGLQHSHPRPAREGYNREGYNKGHHANERSGSSGGTLGRVGLSGGPCNLSVDSFEDAREVGAPVGDRKGTMSPVDELDSYLCEEDVSSGFQHEYPCEPHSPPLLGDKAGGSEGRSSQVVTAGAVVPQYVDLESHGFHNHHQHHHGEDEAAQALYAKQMLEPGGVGGLHGPFSVDDAAGLLAPGSPSGGYLGGGFRSPPSGFNRFGRMLAGGRSPGGFFGGSNSPGGLMMVLSPGRLYGRSPGLFGPSPGGSRAFAHSMQPSEGLSDMYDV